MEAPRVTQNKTDERKLQIPGTKERIQRRTVYWAHAKYWVQMIAATTPKEECIGATYLCYCTVSLFLAGVVGVKAQGGQYSGEGRSGSIQPILDGASTIAGCLAGGRLYPTGHTGSVFRYSWHPLNGGRGTMAGGTQYNGRQRKEAQAERMAEIEESVGVVGGNVE